MTTDLRKATLCILIKPGKILLAMKKRGFGAGRWNGCGGKPEPGEDIEQTAVRETEEEIGVTPVSMRHAATLTFLFAGKPDWDQEVTVYLVDKWEGEPVETEEMAPRWFKVNEIPFDKMWSDDVHWLPKVLDGKRVEGTFRFDGNQALTGFELKTF